MEVRPDQAAAALAERPASLRVRGTLKLDPARPTHLPDELTAVALNAAGCGWLAALPRRLHLSGRLDVSGCNGLRELSPEIRATSVVARGCGSLQSLPGDYASGPFSSCITGVVRSIRFPRSGTTGQEVTFPFSF